MSTFSAGCGIPILISGPKYAMLTPGSGPGLDVEHVADIARELADVLQIGALLRRDLVDRDLAHREKERGIGSGTSP